MMPSIRIDNLGKKYRVDHISPRGKYRTLVETLSHAAGAPLRRLRGQAPARSEEFWALKDVSFEVQPGEVVGIIGRNGAGKSTLLKILSQITKPTIGRVEINGRVASLLEVGTGFHPELTGRENIYLNGAILGMARKEIARKFDEIVAFAEVERFLDTPVKRYSSGMYVRLAFAVAAHLEPELLILDEVLAVGDNNFQRKCLTKMEDVSSQGRTVLFVSHNMDTVMRLCPRVVLLQTGRTIADGPAENVIRSYLSGEQGTMAARSWADITSAPGNEVARLRSVRVRNEEGQTTEVVDIRRPVGIEMVFDVLESGHVLLANLHFQNDDGIIAFIVHDLNNPNWVRRPRPVGTYKSTMWIPGNFLAEGTMIVSPCVSTHKPERVHFHVVDAIGFQVVDSHDGDSARGDYVGHFPGIVRPLFTWDIEYHPKTLPASNRFENVNGSAS